MRIYINPALLKKLDLRLLFIETKGILYNLSSVLNDIKHFLPIFNLFLGYKDLLNKECSQSLEMLFLYHQNCCFYIIRIDDAINFFLFQILIILICKDKKTLGFDYCLK